MGKVSNKEEIDMTQRLINKEKWAISKIVDCVKSNGRLFESSKVDSIWGEIMVRISDSNLSSAALSLRH